MWTWRRWLVAIIAAYVVVTGTLGVVYLLSARGERPSAKLTAAEVSKAPIPLETIMTDRDPSVGNAVDPDLVIVEFGDFQCPFCRKSFPILRELASTYGDRIQYVYRDFPVDEIHRDARRAAEAAQCAHEQGKFWTYHDRLFLNQHALDVASLEQHAKAVGLDMTTFTTCFQQRATAAEVRGDLADAAALGVRGTPTWFFLPNGDAGRVQKIEGVIPREELIQFLEEGLQ
jgi:protein-disulfide isomerase